MRKQLVLLMAVFLLATAAAAFSADLETLVKDRTVVLYPEGQLLGNMVIGSRGKIELIYVDRSLAKALQANPSAPEWLSWHSRHWGTDQAKGKTVFIVRYEAYKPWNFHASDIGVGGRSIEAGDILTNKAYVIEGDIPSGTIAHLAFAVPSGLASPGKATVISYLEESVEWTVPAK